ncbi:hypothetical protein NDU88_002200 [Pleurodeles waltl]|uniref:Uncharacterized protein n=1 Tax=Pleurodeles waltl TaxID=8319 RepID=A0AAV7VZZ3_PLEWA|nr:hypothetical protein NDU88_002200 [Pleurodeles waltl]
MFFRRAGVACRTRERQRAAKRLIAGGGQPAGGRLPLLGRGRPLCRACGQWQARRPLRRRAQSAEQLRLRRRDR